MMTLVALNALNCLEYTYGRVPEYLKNLELFPATVKQTEENISKSKTSLNF